MSKVDLSFIGIGANADVETLAKGKRRLITYLSFLVFVLIAAGLDANEWIKGGLERTPSAGRRMAADERPLPLSDAHPMARQLQGGRPQSLYFRVGLMQIATDSITYSNTLGDWRYFTTYEDRPTYVRWVNAMSVSPNCANATTANWFCGIQPLQQSAFNATFGLLVFSAILAGAAWLGMAAVQNGIPQVVGYKWTYAIIGGLAGGCAFFTTIAIIVFSSANIRTEFCSVFDPDANWNSMPCGWGDGFNAVAAAVFFALSNILLYVFWMPKTAASAKYEFSASAAGGAASAFTGAASGYENIAPAGDGEVVKSAGGYQGIGASNL